MLAISIPIQALYRLARPFNKKVLEDYFVYPIRLPDRLPEIGVPLLPGDEDVPVDLQAVFERCYDAGPYRRRIRYGQVPPEPPLGADRQAWISQLLSGRADIANS